MSLETILAFVVLISLNLYALTGGADFGGGMWDLFATGPGARRQREIIAKAIGPIWEANHVWLILVIVILFVGFPVSFGAIMTALHIPMTAILIGIVLRGSAFAFRSYDKQDDAVHRKWSTLFGQASLFTPFLLGNCLGALASGEIRVQGSTVSTGFFAGWTSPFALACGLFALLLFAFLAATYLTADAREDQAAQEDFRRRGIITCLLLLPASALVFFLAKRGAPYIFQGLTFWWAPLLLVLTTLSALAALTGLWKRWFNLARFAAAAQVSFILVGWGIAQFPYIIVPDISFLSAAGPEPTLRLLVGSLALGAFILFPSFGYLFYVFKRAAKPAAEQTK